MSDMRFEPPTRIADSDRKLQSVLGPHDWYVRYAIILAIFLTIFPFLQNIKLEILGKYRNANVNIEILMQNVFLYLVLAIKK